MQPEVLISVIMGVYNEREKRHVEAAIGSVLRQTCRNFEFIICDDGSDPAFFQWLDAYCKKDDRILLLKNAENRGLAYTLNRCLAHARGKYVARMDADDISHPERFERQAEFLERHPEYALAGCNVYLIDSRGVWGERVLEETPRPRSFLRTSPFVHPAVMVRRSVMEKLHGYTADARALRVEDYEFFMRMYAHGCRGYNMQAVLLRYREDRQAYRKRKYRYRINECRVRYLGFRRLGILKGNMRYVLKPLAAGLVPAGIMRGLRRRRYCAVRRTERGPAAELPCRIKAEPVCGQRSGTGLRQEDSPQQRTSGKKGPE